MLKKAEVKELWPTGEKISKGLKWRILMLGLMFSVGSVMAVITTWSVFADFVVKIYAVPVIGVISAALFELIKSKYKLAWISVALPWPFLLVYTGISSWIAGIQAWLDQIIIKVNEAHSGKIDIFSVNATDADALAFILILALIIGQQSWFIVKEGRIMSAVAGCILWLMIMTVGGGFSPVAATLLICAFFGLLLSGRSIKLMRRNTAWIISLGVILLVIGLNNGKVGAALDLNKAIKEGVHQLRYGSTTLPNGELAKADELQKDNGDMFTISSQQVKSLYLKGFTGSCYSDGRWGALPYTAFVGNNAGMYKWLKNNGFDSMTQVAAYYTLCDDKNTPEQNTISVDISGACSWYGYIPSSLEKLQEGSFKENADRGLVSRGLTGEKNYTYTELSGSKPSELTVVEEWVSNPKTQEEEKYCESEAVYREYVYSNYTQLDDELKSFVDELFWSDYSTKTDSAYNAIEHVRKVLRSNNSYNARVDITYGNDDPLQYFLKNNAEGNSMYFASAGVVALRAYGIPARYAEGYFVSSTALQAAQSDEYTVTSGNAHAWIEVYFDGVGWLPVDVTPGYYMSAADMQQMFEVPENIQKTAAYDDSLVQTDTSGDGSDSSEDEAAGSEKVSSHVGVIALGILALLIIIISIFIFVTETLRALILWVDQRSLEKCPQDVRIRKLENKMYRLLRIYGIDAGLSWNTAETDAQLSNLCSGISLGEYTKACRIIEQQVYGGMAIPVYQERALTAFIVKLFKAGKEQNLSIRIKLHYFI